MRRPLFPGVPGWAPLRTPDLIGGVFARTELSGGARMAATCDIDQIEVADELAGGSGRFPLAEITI